MKKTLILSLAALAVLVTSAVAQDHKTVSTRWDKKPTVDKSKPFSEKSVVASFDFNRVDLAYIHDGSNANYAGLYTPVGVFNSLGVDFGPLLAKGSSASNPTGNDINLGLFFTKPVYDKNGFNVRVGVGFKGVDINDKLSFLTGSGSTVFGAMITIKN